MRLHGRGDRRFARQCVLSLLSWVSAISFFAPQTIFSTDKYWTGATSTAWGTNGNWTGSAPLSGDNAVFNGTFTNQPNLGGNTSAGGIWMTGSVGQNVTISGGSNTLTLSGNTINGTPSLGVLIDNTNAYKLTINCSLKLGSAQTWTNSSSNLFTVGGTVNTNGNALTINGSGSTTISGVISGTGSISKGGTGSVTLSGANTYSGTTTVTAGSLFVNGSTSSSSAVTVNNGGILGGNGTIGGSVTVNNGGTLVPGATGNGSTAILHTGALTMTTGSIYSVNLNGNVAGSGYDQTIAASVALGGVAGVNGATLTLNSVSNLSVGNKLFIILNSSSSAMTSTFNGLAEGATITFGAYNFTIDYFANGDGGTIGNDVALTVTGIPEPATWIMGVVTSAALAFAQRRRLVGLRWRAEAPTSPLTPRVIC
jgi:fibronectin-binding autotransporter adhesin